ncbi:MAG: DUF6338 family protein [Chloroflexota bacterium]
MTLDLEGVLIFVFLLFPGIFARAEADRVSPIPPEQTNRSPLREVADALAYTVVLSPLGAGVAIFILSKATEGAFGLMELFAYGVAGVFQRTPGAALLASGGYVVSSLLIAEVVGATRLLTRIRAGFLSVLPGNLGITDDPIWYEVLTTDMKRYGHTNCYLNVYLDDGSRYTGLKLFFPIVGDDVPDRDFAIWKARHYFADGREVELDPSEVVLLNTGHCRAVEVRYVTPGLTVDNKVITLIPGASDVPPERE